MDTSGAEKNRCLAGLRALVIEDEYFIAEDLKHILRREGAAVVRLSGDIDDAFRQVGGERFDVALVDIDMHGEMAFALADELSRQKVAFAFVSGLDRSHIPERFAAVPNCGKPYDDKQVVRDVERLWSQGAT